MGLRTETVDQRLAPNDLQKLGQTEASETSETTFHETVERLFIERVVTRFKEIDELVSAAKEALPRIKEDSALVGALPQVLKDMSELIDQTIEMIESREERGEEITPSVLEESEIELIEGEPMVLPEAPVLQEVVLEKEEEISEEERARLEGLLQKLPAEDRERAQSQLEGKEMVGIKFFTDFWGISRQGARYRLNVLSEKGGEETKLPPRKKGERIKMTPIQAARFLVAWQENPPIKPRKKVEPSTKPPQIEAIKAENITLERLLNHLEERIGIPAQVLEDLRGTLKQRRSRMFKVKKKIEIWLWAFMDKRGGQKEVLGAEVSLFGLALVRRSALFFQGTAEHKLLKVLGRIRGPGGEPEVLTKLNFSRRQFATELFQKAVAQAERVKAIESKAELVVSLNGLNEGVFLEIDEELEELASGAVTEISLPFLKFIAGAKVSLAEGCCLPLYRDREQDRDREQKDDYIIGDGIKAYKAYQWQPEDEVPVLS